MTADAITANGSLNSNKRIRASTTTGSSDQFRDKEEDDSPVFPSDTSVPRLDPLTQNVVEATAQDLQALSVKEQGQVIKDIYGLPEDNKGNNDTQEVEETPEFLQTKLRELHQEIQKAPVRKKHAYQMAVGQNKAYVLSSAFGLQFLRPERFQVAPAANRLLAHLDLKLECFGKELLTKNLTQDDLDPLSLQALYGGICIDCPVRDRAGRQVCMFAWTKENCQQLEALPIANRMRALFYSTTVGGRDENTQRLGRVYIVWITGTIANPSDLWRLTRITAGVPFAYRAIHMCVDSAFPWVVPLTGLAQLAMAAKLRLQVRRHTGTPAQLKHILTTFGMPVDYLPIFGKEGRFNLDLYKTRWHHIANQERSSAVNLSAGEMDTLALRFVNTPTNADVLMGKGRGVQDHVGNVRFRQLIDQKLPYYELASKSEKTKMAREIIRTVRQDWKGRFLTASDRNWIVMADEAKIRSKVSVCFRDARKQGNKNNSTEGKISVETEVEKSDIETFHDCIVPGLEREEDSAEEDSVSFLNDLNDDPLIELLLMDL